MFKTLQKYIGLALALAFMTTALLGLNMGMEAHPDGTMSNCVFYRPAACPMNYQEHVSHWQKTFTAALPAPSFLFASLFAVALSGAALLFYLLSQRRLAARRIRALPQTVFRQRALAAKLSDPILRALSDGILNPRLYNLSGDTC